MGAKMGAKMKVIKTKNKDETEEEAHTGTVVQIQTVLVRLEEEAEGLVVERAVARDNGADVVHVSRRQVAQRLDIVDVLGHELSEQQVSPAKGRERKGGGGPTHADAVLLEALGADHRLAVQGQTEGLALGTLDGRLPLLPGLGAVLLGHLAAARTAQQPVAVLGQPAVDSDGEAAVARGAEGDLPGSRYGLCIAGPVGIGVFVVVIVGVAVRVTPLAFLGPRFSLTGYLALVLALAFGLCRCDSCCPCRARHPCGSRGG